MRQAVGKPCLTADSYSFLCQLSGCGRRPARAGVWERPVSALPLYNEQTVPLEAQFSGQIQPKQLSSQFVSRIQSRRAEGGGGRGRGVGEGAQCPRGSGAGTSVAAIPPAAGAGAGAGGHCMQISGLGGNGMRSSVSRGAGKHPKPDNRFPFLPAALVKCRANLLNGSEFT